MGEQHVTSLGRFRTLLKTNKIFFETVAAVALTTMSLVVSVGSCQVSRDALEVSKRQLALSEAEAAPVFRVDRTSLYQGDLLGPPSEDDKRFLSGLDTLINDGAPVLRTGFATSTILRLSGKGTKVRWIALDDPIHAEFRYDEPGDKPKRVGVLADFREERWHLNGYEDLLKKIHSGCDAGMAAACRAAEEQGFETIAELTYLDRFGRAGTFYFTLFSDDAPQGQDELRSLYTRFAKATASTSVSRLAQKDAKQILALAQD
jgi:hypothetical protein